MSAAGLGLVVVAGGCSGIGEAAACSLLRTAARVIVFDVNPRTECEAGIIVWPRPVDVADEDSVECAIGEIETEHGPIEGLVNAAGILGRMHRPERIRMEIWDREMAVDLRGTFLVCRAVGARMVARQRGSIVNVASIAGMSSAPAHAYAAAKAAVIHLTMTLAGDWGRRGVRVNAVSPGFTRTPALEAGLAAGALDRERLVRNSALGRLVEPAEVAAAISWLIGSESSGVTGTNIPVDAGFLAGATFDTYGGFR